MNYTCQYILVSSSFNIWLGERLRLCVQRLQPLQPKSLSRFELAKQCLPQQGTDNNCDVSRSAWGSWGWEDALAAVESAMREAWTWQTCEARQCAGNATVELRQDIGSACYHFVGIASSSGACRTILGQGRTWWLTQRRHIGLDIMRGDFKLLRWRTSYDMLFFDKPCLPFIWLCIYIIYTSISMIHLWLGRMNTHSAATLLLTRPRVWT